MKRVIRCIGPCWKWDCDCKLYDGADPEKVGYPPYHEDCMCLVEEEDND